MIIQRYFERDGGRTLFRIAVSDTAVFDVLSTDAELERTDLPASLDESKPFPNRAAQGG